jgi:hypothetical protein
MALWVTIPHNLLIWIRDVHAPTPPASLVQPVSLA